MLSSSASLKFHTMFSFYSGRFSPFLFAALLVSCKADGGALSNSDRANNVQIESLIGQMSLEDKVGQMTQLTLGFLSSSEQQHDGKEKQVDWNKVQTAIETHRVGSILNAMGNALPIEEWHEIVNGIQELALAQPLQIPVLYGIDAIHGTTYTQDATLFPHNLGMAATRSKALTRQASLACAAETRASGLRWTFDPVFDVGRQPLWPRFPETFGESAHLCSVLGSEVVRAYEGAGLNRGKGVAACMKHFLGYSVPASGKDRTEAYLSDLELWEHHIPPFQAGVDAGASTVMINSGSVNGAPVHASFDLLTTLLRERMGFEGVVVSDWQDVIRLHTRHKVASSKREAVKMAIEAGLDISMVPNEYSFCEHLLDLVRTGEISEERIDESVYRILALKAKLGLFEVPGVEPEAVEKFGLPEYRTTALEAAEASLVLLENKNNILPLSGSEKLLVLGPTSAANGPLHGCWSYSWQGNVEAAYPEDTPTLVEALRDVFGPENVVCPVESGFDAPDHYTVNVGQQAEEADVIVLCLGENAYAESPGVIDDFHLPAEQVKLAQRAIKTGKPVVLLLLEGRGRLVSKFVDDVDAVLLALLPGSQGAMAIARTLGGLSNPSGILPFTYHRHTGDLVPYDHRFTSKVIQSSPGVFSEGAFRPQWKFGHGLTYSNLKLDLLDVSSPNNRLGEDVTLNYRVVNSSGRDAVKALDVFVGDDFASGLAPRRRVLVAFDRVDVPAMSSVEGSISVPHDAFGYVDEEGEMHFEAGTFTVELSGQSQGLHLDN